MRVGKATADGGGLVTFGRCYCSWLLPLVVACACSGANLASAQDYSPEHPKVRAMVAKGVEYLSNIQRPMESNDGGTEILIGYTLFKATGQLEHPKVTSGLSIAVDMARSLADYQARGDSKIVYAASVAAVFMADVDSVKYRPELELVLRWLLYVQKDHGGFGYLTNPHGDTSQVQYAMLALWTLHNVGLEVPMTAVERTVKYLEATVDPSGGWGYEGIISSGRPVAQERVSKSLATAGAGALLIACDVLGFFGKLEAANDADGVPEAFVQVNARVVELPKSTGGAMRLNDVEPLIEEAEKYHQQNGFTKTGLNFYYYWRYAEERYESFREIQAGKREKSPDWFNQGVTELAKLQGADGRWPQSSIPDFNPDDICTCFAVLYLVRSTQATIKKMDEGIAFGGYGLPTDVATAKMLGNRIVSTAEASVEDMLKMLEEDGASAALGGLVPENLQLAKDPVERAAQLSRLSRLLVSGDYMPRRIAAKLLGRSEDLNRVPELIYALSDEDPYVPQYAEESLRLLSRKLSQPPLPVEPDLGQRKAAMEFWKQWYLGLRPEYVFIER